MIVIPPYQTAVSLFCKDGSVSVYASLAQAKKELGIRWIARSVGKHFREYLCTTRTYDTDDDGNLVTVRKPEFQESEYVMRDDAGQPVTLADFQALTSREKYISYWARKYATWNGEGPVPGVRKWRGGRHYFRHFHVMHSRRQASFFAEEGEVAPRCSQNEHGIPDPWDDQHVSAREDRSWKRYRRTQYKSL
jgi:hypothetical protein